MAQPVYATLADLPLDPLPPAAAGQLVQASRLVRRATMTARYVTDDAGRPTDTAVADALRDATVAQVLAWQTSGVDPSTGAAQPPAATVASKKIGSAQITYGSGDASVVAADQAARSSAATTLTQDAYLILADAGLTSPRPGAYR